MASPTAVGKKANPTPAECPEWGTFNVREKHNQDVIHALLEDAVNDTRAAPGSEREKVRDFYLSGMDEAGINIAGFDPLKPELARIPAISDTRDLQADIARLQLMGVDAVFRVGENQDLKVPTGRRAEFRAGIG